MADLTLRLQPLAAPATTLVLRALSAAVVASTVLYLTPVASPATTLVLRPVGVSPASTPAFPTQYSGLRVRGVSATLDLCLVDTADAPSGDTPRIRKGATTYAVYLVDTSDPLASPVRIETGAGVKAIRLKT